MKKLLALCILSLMAAPLSFAQPVPSETNEPLEITTTELETFDPIDAIEGANPTTIEDINFEVPAGTDAQSFDSLMALGTGLMIGLGLFFAGLFLFLIIAYWEIFTKAGKPGWHILIPILNIITYVRITGTGWYVLYAFIAALFPLLGAIHESLIIPVTVIGQLASLAISFMFSYKTAKSFGKGIGFSFGLFLLGFIFIPILAFNKNIQYVGPGGKPKA